MPVAHRLGPARSGPSGRRSSLRASAFMPGARSWYRQAPVQRRRWSRSARWVAADRLRRRSAGSCCRRRRQRSTPAATCIGRACVATLAMEVGQRPPARRASSPSPSGVSPLRVWFGTMAESALPLFIYSIFGLLLAVVWSYVGADLAPCSCSRRSWSPAGCSPSSPLRQEAYEATMRSLIKAVETKDLYTRGHSERVSRASVLIGRSAGMREDRVASLRYAGMLHDVGKLGVPTARAAEGRPAHRRRVRGDPAAPGRAAARSPRTSSSSARRSRASTCTTSASTAAATRWAQGRGDPRVRADHRRRRRLRLDDHHALLPRRPQRSRTPFDELRRCKGSQFDPVMVEALIEAIEAAGLGRVRHPARPTCPAPPRGRAAFGERRRRPDRRRARLGLPSPCRTTRPSSTATRHRDRAGSAR